MRPYILVLLIASLAAPLSHAEIFKVVRPDGSVYFTDNPPEDGMADVEKLDYDGNISNQLETGTTQQAIEAEFKAETDAREVIREKAWSSYYNALDKAKKNLKQAKEALEKAKEVQDGDLLATRGPNGNRIIRRSEGYYARIEKAQERVNKAEKRLQSVMGKKPKLAKPD